MKKSSISIKGVQVPFDVSKSYDDGKNWYVEGDAAAAGADRQNEMISEEFLKGIAQDLKENKTVFLDHDHKAAIGVVKEAKHLPGRVRIKVLISKTVPQVWQKIKEGVLNSFSVFLSNIKWKPVFDKVKGSFIKYLTDGECREVSIVGLPAQPKARIFGWEVAKALNLTEGGENMDTLRN